MQTVLVCGNYFITSMNKTYKYTKKSRNPRCQEYCGLSCYIGNYSLLLLWRRCGTKCM